MTWSDGLFVICIGLVAGLTAGSMAVRSVSRIWLRHWAERRLHGSAAAVTYLERPQRLLLAAAAMTSMALVWSGELLATRSAGWRLPATLIVTAAIVTLLQAAARGVARRWPTQFFSRLVP